MYDSQNGYVYLPNDGSNNVSIINGPTVVGAAPAGNDPMAATYDSQNGYVYVSDFGSGDVVVINNTTALARPTVGNSPVALTFDSGNGFIYVPNAGSDNVSVINGTLAVGAVNAGVRPETSTYDPDNGLLLVPDMSSNNVTAIETGYSVLFNETGLPNGTLWWVNITGLPSHSTNGTNLSSFSPDGARNYTAGTANKTFAAPGGSYLVNGSGLVVSVNFSLVLYPVTFTETGLGTGINWTVVLAGVTNSSTSSTIGFAEPNGTSPYRIGALAGWATSAYNGSIAVDGAAVPVGVAWSRVTYGVRVQAQGLPPYAGWWINLSGGPHSFSMAGNQSFLEPNGTYSFASSASDRTYATPAGSFTVQGAPAVVTLVFSRVTYPVAFLEQGLAQGTNWSVGVYGGEVTSTSRSAILAVPNGTYPYAVGSVAGYTSAPSSGSLTVNGAGLSVDIAFTANPVATYTVLFEESGLPSGTNWSVALGGATHSGSGEIGFPGLTNGTYRFSIAPIDGYVVTPSNGTVIVDGPPGLQSAVFAALPSTSVTGGMAPMEEYGAVGAVLVVVLVGIGVAVVVRRRKGKAPPDSGASPAVR